MSATGDAMKSALVAIFMSLIPMAGSCQELRVGHLETANDAGVNWLYFHCNQAGPLLRCAVFQTLIFTNIEARTCSVLNDFSEADFTWNEQANAWVSREGPIGPCGRINVGTLRRDPDAQTFWVYTEKRITTRSSGTLGNGMSCEQVPELTLNYTWRAASNPLGCTYVKNLMN